MGYPRRSNSPFGDIPEAPGSSYRPIGTPEPAQPPTGAKTIGARTGATLADVYRGIKAAPGEVAGYARDVARDPLREVGTATAPLVGAGQALAAPAAAARSLRGAEATASFMKNAPAGAVAASAVPSFRQSVGALGLGASGTLALAQTDRAQTEGMQRRGSNVTVIDNGQMLPDSAFRNPPRARVIDNGQQLPESAFTPGSAFKTARPDFQFAPADGNVMPGRNYADGVQRRGAQGGVIKNPHGMKIEDRLAGLLSSMKGSPSLRRAAAEAIIGEQQNEFNARQATLDRNDRAESDQMNAQLRANESYADRRLKADTFNQDLGLRRRSEQNGNALDKTRLALDTRRQLFDERLAAQQAQSTGAKAISDRYNKVVDDYMKRYPDATFDEAQGYAADLAHRQGYNSQAIDVGRGVDYQRAAAVDDAAAAASGRGIAGTARRWAQNKLTGLDDGDVRSLNENPSNYVPEELGFPRRVGRAVGSFVTLGGVGDFDGQMHSDDVVWRDKATGKSFAAPRETLGGMTVEGFRRRYNDPSDYLRRIDATQN